MLYKPVGVEEVVLIAKVLEKDGEPELGLNVHEASVGSPLHEKVTGWEIPMSKVAVIVLDPDPPWTVLIRPEFVIP